MRAYTTASLLTSLTLIAAGCGGHDASRRAGVAPGSSATTAAVLSVTPAEGPERGGNTVVVETAGFARAFDPAADQITLGGAPLTQLRALSATTIEGVAAAGTGTVDVVVNQGGEVAALTSGYTYSPPRVDGVTPNQGLAGDRVLVSASFFGQDFTTRLPDVTFGGLLAAQVTALTPTQVMVTVPPGAGVVDVTLTTTVPPETATLAQGWSYGGSAPSLAVTLETGLDSPGMLISQAPAADLLLAQATLTSPVDAQLEAFGVTADGTIDEALGLGDVVLYHDVNGDGARDAGDVQLGGAGFPTNGATLVYTGLSLALPAATPVHVIVVTELRSSAAVGDVVAFRCRGADARATVNGNPLLVQGAAASGSLQVTGGAAPKTFAVGPGASPVLTGALSADVASLPMLSLRCTTTTGEIDLHRVAFRTSGSGDDAADVLEATLALDVNRNGFFDAGDQVLGRGRPDGDDGLLSFALGGQRLASATSSYDLVLSYTLAGTAEAGESFQATLATSGVYAHAYYGTGGQVVTLTPSVIQGPLRVVTTPTAALRAQARNPGAAIVPAGQETLALALAFTAGDQAVDLTDLTVHARGTLDDAAHVAALNLYADVDQDGRLSAADALLAGPRTFAADDGAVTLSPAAPITVPARTRVTWLVGVTLAAGAPDGATLGLRLDPAQDVQASQAAAAGLEHGSLLIAGSGEAAWIQPDPELGKDAYLRGEGLYLNDNFGHTHGLLVGDRDFGQLGHRLSYIEFPLPAVPQGRTVAKAYLALHVASTANLSAPALDVQALRVIPSGDRTPWNEGRGGLDASLDGIVFDGATQATRRTDQSMPDVDAAALDEVRVTAAATGQWVLLDVTAAAQAWYAGTSPNLGLSLRDKDWNTHDDGWVTFWSSDVASADLRPQLVIEHR